MLYNFNNPLLILHHINLNSFAKVSLLLELAMKLGQKDKTRPIGLEPVETSVDF